MLHDVYVFKKNEEKDYRKKQLLTWDEFKTLLKNQEIDTKILRYNSKTKEWFEYNK